MECCYKCGVSDAKALLFGVVLTEKIDKICKKCSHKEDLPLILKTNVTEETEPRLTVHERLAKLANIDLKKKPENEELKKEETKLNEIVSRNFRRTIGTNTLKDDLVDNFHWFIMRARRGKHMSQKELAEEIRESEVLVRMAERGIINEMDIVKKFEVVLSIRLRKIIEHEDPEEIDHSEFEIKEDSDKFSVDKFKGLRIQDLQEMKQDRELGVLEEPVEFSGFEDFEELEEFKSESEKL